MLSSGRNTDPESVELLKRCEPATPDDVASGVPPKMSSASENEPIERVNFDVYASDLDAWLLATAEGRVMDDAESPTLVDEVLGLGCSSSVE